MLLFTHFLCLFPCSSHSRWTSLWISGPPSFPSPSCPALAGRSLRDKGDRAGGSPLEYVVLQDSLGITSSREPSLVPQHALPGRFTSQLRHHTAFWMDKSRLRNPDIPEWSPSSAAYLPCGLEPMSSLSGFGCVICQVRVHISTNTPGL